MTMFRSLLTTLTVWPCGYHKVTTIRSQATFATCVTVYPVWASKFIEIYTEMGWKDIGLAFYRMPTGTVMPVHSDLYKRYIELFDLAGKEQSIRRALVLMEDWKPGHYLEANGTPYVSWQAGTTVEWTYDTPHSAANIGLQDRYTLQITGHI